MSAGGPAAVHAAAAAAALPDHIHMAFDVAFFLHLAFKLGSGLTATVQSELNAHRWRAAAAVL
jgi:hypothetical protein